MKYKKKYYDVGSDPTCGKDWMDVTDQMQHEFVREFSYSDEAVQLLRRVPQVKKAHSSLLCFSVYLNVLRLKSR